MLTGRKILQILPELGSGGVERGTVEVARALSEAGAAPLVASAGGKMVAQCSAAGATHFELPLASKKPLTMWRNITRLKELIAQEKPDIIHARSRAPAWSAYFAAKATNTPFITTFHGVYNGYEGGLKQRYNAIMTKGERVIAVSQFVGDHIARYYPKANLDHLRVIHRGADVEYFDPEKINPMRIVELCKHWRLPEDHQPIILMPGRLTRWKGQHVLIEALGKLPHRNFYCILLGEPGKHPDYVKELEQQVTALELEGHVRMVGTTQHMRDAYAAADLVISPAIEPEAFGRVPVEAQAMGKPVIATAHGGAMETVRTDADFTGWLAEPENVDDLAEKIETALALTEPDKTELTTRARTHVIHHFSTAAMCDKVLSVYAELLDANQTVNKIL